LLLTLEPDLDYQWRTERGTQGEETMPPKRPVSVVFIRGLAKKPAPDKLKEMSLAAPRLGA
jgi:hypothetical protein